MATTLDNTWGVEYGAVIELRTEQCFTCGMLFGIPLRLYKKLLDSRSNNKSPLFYCPMGHSQYYLGKTESQIEREGRERAEAESKRLAESRNYFEGKLKDTTQILRATKGVVTRKKRELDRVKNGVCPCCNRSFANLHNHMKSQHPDFQKA